MATVICVDGLGGHPEVTFDFLKRKLLSADHEVVVIDTSSVVTHEDRVRLVLDAYYSHVTGSEAVFLVGQSAGGSAVRIVAERLHQLRRPLAGVVMLSPAMPWGIQYMTETLWKVMRGRVSDLMLGRMIRTTEHEYRVLVEPGIHSNIERAVRHRTMISGNEARTLAFVPPVFHGYNYPTLHVFGDQDRWINCKAQWKLGRKMLSAGQQAEIIELKNVGHLTLASWQAPWVATQILRWISKR